MLHWIFWHTNTLHSSGHNKGLWMFFCHWWPELPWNANSFHVQKEKSWGPQNGPPPFTKNGTLEGAIKERCLPRRWVRSWWLLIVTLVRSKVIMKLLCIVGERSIDLNIALVFVSSRWYWCHFIPDWAKSSVTKNQGMEPGPKVIIVKLLMVFVMTMTVMAMERMLIETTPTTLPPIMPPMQKIETTKDQMNVTDTLHALFTECSSPGWWREGEGFTWIY